MALSNIILGQTASPNVPNISGEMGAGLRTGATVGAMQRQAQQQGQRFREETDQNKLIEMANNLNTALSMGPGQAQDDILKQVLNRAAPGTAPAISINAALSSPNPTEKQELLTKMVQNAQQRGLLRPGSSDVAGIQEFDYLAQGLGEDERARARRIKLGLSPRALESAEQKGEKAFAVEEGKLKAKLKLSPDVQKAVASAKNEASSVMKDAGTKKSNETAWNVYQKSMDNLSKSLGGSETGPFVGFIPAMTQNQQIAEGAVAIMAPVLKQMFRAAGEGVFTDKDQELLMKMVPTRKDLPASREAKIKAIDGVVRAKLGLSSKSKERASQTGNNVVQDMSDEELKKIAFGGK